MIPSNIINTNPPMRVQLEFLKPCEFFWLKAIQAVDISKCCAKCFIGPFDQGFWDATHGENVGKPVDIIIRQYPRAKAYYLCGLSKNFVWKLNTHVAFVPDKNSEIHVENDRIKLHISNARRIQFWDYTPAPEGEYTRKQRTCRNWIFANYLKDGMPL